MTYYSGFVPDPTVIPPGVPVTQEQLGEQLGAYVGQYNPSSVTSIREPEADPRSWGAKFDGTTDDTTALNDAFLAVHNATDGKVRLPAGVSKFSNLTLYPRTRVEGMGSNITSLSRITGSTGAALTDIAGQGATSIELTAFTLECNSCAGNGLDLGNQAGGPDFNYWGTLRDFIVRDAGAVGMNLLTDTIFTENCGAYNCNQGVVITGGTGSTHLFMHLVNNATNDLVVDAGGTSTNWFGLTIQRQAAYAGSSILLNAGANDQNFVGLVVAQSGGALDTLLEIAVGVTDIDVVGLKGAIGTGGTITNLIKVDAWSGLTVPGSGAGTNVRLGGWHYHANTEHNQTYIDATTGKAVTIGDGIAMGTIATNATHDFGGIPTCAGAPTGVPASGNGAMVYDTTDNKFYVYNGAWKAVALA